MKDGKLVGVIAYHKMEPVGFVESFPLDLAIKLGYPVSRVDANRLMITCLSVRDEVSGYGVGSNLIRRLAEEVKKKYYKSLEVISFPDEHNFNPVSFYKKLGFKEVKKIGDLSLLQYNLLL